MFGEIIILLNLIKQHYLYHVKEMEHNQNDGEYNIFFSRGYANPRDVKQYSSNYFLNSIYSNFSEIYSSKFNDSDAIPYEIDNYYAIFA